MQINYNEAATEDEGVRAVTREWAKTGPLSYIYAPSGTGKSHWIGTLFECQDYWPVLYIGIESSHVTFAQYAKQPELCTLWPFDVHPSRKLAWVYEKLRAAEDVECGAIVIEGLTSVHRSLISREVCKVSENTKIEGMSLRQKMIDPSIKMGAVFQAVHDLKQARVSAGTGCPIICSLNTKRDPVDPDNSRCQKTFIVPAASVNLREIAMSSADAFMEMVLQGQNRRLLCHPRSPNQWRKVRHAGVAQLVENTLDLSAPGFLALYANTLSQEGSSVAEQLAELARQAKQQDKPKETP